VKLSTSWSLLVSLAIASNHPPVAGFVVPQHYTDRATIFSNNVPVVRHIGYANSSTERMLFSGFGSIVAAKVTNNFISKKINNFIYRKRMLIRKRAIARVKDLLRGKIDDLAIDKLLDKMDISESTKVFFEDDLDDLYTTFICSSLPEAIIGQNNDSYTNKDFTNLDEDGGERFDLGWVRTGKGFDEWKKGFIPAETVEITNGVTISRIRIDSIYGPPTTMTDLTLQVPNSSVIFPLEDKIAIFESKEQLKTLVKEVKLNGINDGGASPEPYPEGDWGDKTSDEHFARFFFHGLGASLLEQQTNKSSRPELGPVEIDMDFMKGLSVRNGFREYGAKIYFDSNQKPTGIYDGHKDTLFLPGEKGWEGAKYLAKSSAITLTTAREHLLMSHLLCSNYLSLASIKHLPPSHPIRRLVNVFTFRTNAVNDNAFTSLVPKNGFFHRGSALEHESLRAVFENSFENSNVFEPFPKRNMIPELKTMSESGMLPYHMEGVEYYTVVEEFVRSWLTKAGDATTDQYAQAFYEEIRDSTVGQKYTLPPFENMESIVQVLSQALFIVTGYHEIIGTVIDYTNDNSMGYRIMADDADGNPATQTDAQSFFIWLIVTASTALKVPMLMAPYKKYFGKNGAPRWERNEWADFQRALRKQSKTVKRRRRGKGDIEFLFFDPKRFESAISV
jgi:hypothetical protein